MGTTDVTLSAAERATAIVCMRSEIESRFADVRGEYDSGQLAEAAEQAQGLADALGLLARLTG